MLALRIETDGTYGGTKVWEAETEAFLYLNKFNFSLDSSSGDGKSSVGSAHLIGPADKLLSVLLPHRGEASSFTVDYDPAKGPKVDAIFLKVRLEVVLTNGRTADARDLVQPAGLEVDPGLLGLLPRVIREE